MTTSMSDDVVILPDADSLAERAARHFVHIAASAISKRDIFRVALSGGSTPRKMYSILLNESFIHRVDWNRVHIFWSDERYVPHDDPESNYGMANQDLLKHLPLLPSQIHPIQTKPSPEQAALDYILDISENFNIPDPHGSVPRFDLILLGMGPDGHTASLFPHTRALEIQDKWVVENYVDTIDSWRITFTPMLINAAAHVIFLVAGKNKAESLNEIINYPIRVDDLPAKHIHPVNGRLIWLVDEAAASQLGPGQMIR